VYSAVNYSAFHRFFFLGLGACLLAERKECQGLKGGRGEALEERNRGPALETLLVSATGLHGWELLAEIEKGGFMEGGCNAGDLSHLISGMPD